ncbi:MAG: hypothetical protein ACKVT1_00175 [Dehalococcoidia bacterium]
MVEVKNPERAKATIEAQVAKIAWLRGTGPNPFEYGLWDERTREIVDALFGEQSDQRLRYDQAAGKRGRLPGVRGEAEDMTLNIHGQWGILGRLERAEALLNEFARKLG